MNPPTPNQAADMLDPSPGDVAGGVNEKRLQKVVAVALELDQARNGALRSQPMKSKRERELREAARSLLLDYPAANDSAVADMALNQVHGTDPDPGLIEYLEDQQAAAAGWTDSGYCDPDTLSDWDHLHDDAVALDHAPSAATRTGRTVEAAELAPEQQASRRSAMQEALAQTAATFGYTPGNRRDTLDQVRELKREAGQVEDQTPAHLAAALASKIGNTVF